MTPIPYDKWMTPDGRDRRKCPVHNVWMRKGKCEPCRVAAEKRQREYEKTGGSSRPPVKIGTL